MGKLLKISDGVYVNDSGKEGNSTSIMVGVHGDEFSGIEVLENIMNAIDIDFGKVYFIYANLEAMKQKSRYIEVNMNRCFLEGQNGKTYEEKRVTEIMKYLQESDFLLDVHNTTSEVSSIPFLITTHLEYVKYFYVGKVVSQIDIAQPGGSDGYMDNIGKKGFCLECGSINFGDKNSTLNLARNSILNFLKVTKNINESPQVYENRQLMLEMKSMYITQTEECMLSKKYKDFEYIESGTIIGKDGSRDLKLDNASYILFPHEKTKLGGEAFCLLERV